MKKRLMKVKSSNEIYSQNQPLPTTPKGLPHLCASGVRMVVDQIKNLLCFGV